MLGSLGLTGDESNACGVENRKFDLKMGWHAIAVPERIETLDCRHCAELIVIPVAPKLSKPPA